MKLTLLAVLVCCLFSTASAQYVEKLITTPADAYAMRYDSVDNRIFCDGGDTSLFAIDGAADSVIADFRVPGQPIGMCYDSQDDRLYWVDWDSSLVRGMDAATYQLVARVPVGLTPGVAGWNPVNDRLYCSCTEAASIRSGS